MDLEFMIALSVWLVVAIVLTVADRVLLGRWYGDQAQWLLWPVLILAAFGITILYLLTRSWPSVRLSDVPTLLASLAQIITDPVASKDLEEKIKELLWRKT